MQVINDTILLALDDKTGAIHDLHAINRLFSAPTVKQDDVAEHPEGWRERLARFGARKVLWLDSGGGSCQDSCPVRRSSLANGQSSDILCSQTPLYPHFRMLLQNTRGLRRVHLNSQFIIGISDT